MNTTHNDQTREAGPAMPDRRNFLIAGAGVVAATLLPNVSGAAQVQAGQKSHLDKGVPAFKSWESQA